MESDFKNLPTTLTSEELADYFNEFLKIYTNSPKTQYALQELFELAYRQWDTYEQISSELSEKISDYLISAINPDSYETMDIILSIVENLSLKSVFDYIISIQDDVKNSSIVSLIEEAKEEYSDRICNPFLIDDF